MSDTQWMPPPTKDFNAAKRQYVEQFGSLLVMNTYLKIAFLALCVVTVALVMLNFKTYMSFHDIKPLVIRIDGLGRAEAIRYDDFSYQPQEAEIRYFLSTFVEQHYSRVRATVKENYGRSLYFLDGRLADSVMENNKKSDAIEMFLVGQGEEVEAHVSNVSIQDLRTSPYRATVDFEKVYLAPGSHEVSKRERYIASLVFVVKDQVTNSMIPVNPLGLTITYFRDDQAFK